MKPPVIARLCLFMILCVAAAQAQAPSWAGHLFDNGQNWSLFVVRDDRLHTGQADWRVSGGVRF